MPRGIEEAGRGFYSIHQTYRQEQISGPSRERPQSPDRPTTQKLITMHSFITNHCVDDAAAQIEAEENWKNYKQPATGSHQAHEDGALLMYFQVLNATGDKNAASQAYFEYFHSLS